MTSAAVFPPYPDPRPRSPGALNLGTAHRRLDLQSPADLAHLKRAARRAARSRIDLHLPPATADATLGGQDALQKGVEERVSVFLDTTYDGVARNTSLNGVDAETVAWDGQSEDAPEEYEPFNGRLAEKLARLSAEIEEMNILLADKRRRAAGAAAEAWRNGYAQGDQTLETTLAAFVVAEQQRLSEQGATELSLDSAGVPIERREEAASTWNETMDGIKKLAPALGSTHELAREAVEGVSWLKTGQASA